MEFAIGIRVVDVDLGGKWAFVSYSENLTAVADWERVGTVLIVVGWSRPYRRELDGLNFVST